MTGSAWLIALLLAADGDHDPNPGRDCVTGLEHALQTATRAEEDDSDPEEVLMALVHDAARPLSDANHGAVIAEMMAGRLPSTCTEALRHHGVFQNDVLTGRTQRRQFADEPWYPVALRLARWDAASFEVGYHTPPLDHFLPLLVALP